MITAVVDTNVLASGFVRPEPAPGQLLLAWRDRLYTLVVSEHILVEFARTLEEPYFSKRLAPAERQRNLTLLRDEAVITPITVEVHGVATHQEDDVVLSTALSVPTDYLVTGDKKLQKLHIYQGVTILSPREFVEILARDNREN